MGEAGEGQADLACVLHCLGLSRHMRVTLGVGCGGEEDRENVSLSEIGF